MKTSIREVIARVASLLRRRQLDDALEEPNEIKARRAARCRGLEERLEALPGGPRGAPAELTGVRSAKRVNTAK
jgi:hypothetical protein